MRILAMAAATAVLAVAVATAHADPITSVVVFGDSLSDNGNTFAQTGFLPPPPYAGGRFSNGPVAVEQLAANLGVPLLDFAYGGATSGTTNVLNGQYGPFTVNGLPGMQTELQNAISGGKLPSSLASSLVVVWGGANDFETVTNPTVAGVENTAATAAGNIDGIVAKLQSLGATDVLVPNLPDLSKTPEFSGSLAPAASLYTTVFNQTLASTLPTGATLFDTDAVFTSILSDPGSFGLNNTTDECLLAGAFPSCSGYLFFDDLHPTTAVDGYLAQDFQNAVSTTATPEPSSLVLLGSGLVGAAGVARRRQRRAERQD